MTWVCNASPHRVLIVMMELPLGFEGYCQGPPLDYRHRLTTDPILSQMVGIYIKPSVDCTAMHSSRPGVPWGRSLQNLQTSLTYGLNP